MFSSRLLSYISVRSRYSQGPALVYHRYFRLTVPPLSMLLPEKLPS